MDDIKDMLQRAKIDKAKEWLVSINKKAYEEIERDRTLYNIESIHLIRKTP